MLVGGEIKNCLMDMILCNVLFVVMWLEIVLGDGFGGIRIKMVNGDVRLDNG